MRKNKIIKLVIKERWNYLVLEPNYHTSKFFTENVLAIEMRKIQILINKLAYLGLSISQLSKTVMYVFWYNYVKPEYGNKKMENFAIWIQSDSLFM